MVCAYVPDVSITRCASRGVPRVVLSMRRHESTANLYMEIKYHAGGITFSILSRSRLILRVAA